MPVCMGEDINQPLLLPDAYQGETEDHAEKHNGRYDTVRQRVEGIRRDVKADEIEWLLRLHQRCAEKRSRLLWRECQRYEQRHCQRDRPSQGEDQACPEPEGPGLIEPRAPDPRDKGDRDIGQHRHLQEPDVAVGDVAQKGGAFAQEDSEQNARGDRDQDSR